MKLKSGIPKSGSASIIQWWHSLHGRTIKTRIWKHFDDESYEVLYPLDEYHKCILVRDPYRRLVSGYLDKITYSEWNKKRHGAKEVAAVQERKGIEFNREAGITFREFVEYIMEQPDDELDPHWRPQFMFTGKFEYDAIYKVENLQSDIIALCHAIGVDPKAYPINHLHRRVYATKWSGFVDEWPAPDFKKRPWRERVHPPWQWFYPPDLKEMVTHKYRGDFNRFGYPHG